MPKVTGIDVEGGQVVAQVGDCIGFDRKVAALYTHVSCRLVPGPGAMHPFARDVRPIADCAQEVKTKMHETKEEAQDGKEEVNNSKPSGGETLGERPRGHPLPVERRAFGTTHAKPFGRTLVQEGEDGKRRFEDVSVA